MNILLEFTTLNYRIWHSMAVRLKEFYPQARFAGVARDIMVPISRVIAIYARENGQGMAFPMAVPDKPEARLPRDATPRAATDSRALQLTRVETGNDAAASARPPEPDPPRPPAGSRPSLKRVK